MSNRDDDAEDEGRRCQENGGDWRDNPYRQGSREWFAFEDGRREAGASARGAGTGQPGMGMTRSAPSPNGGNVATHPTQTPQ